MMATTEIFSSIIYGYQIPTPLHYFPLLVGMSFKDIPVTTFMSLLLNCYYKYLVRRH